MSDRKRMDGSAFTGVLLIVIGGLFLADKFDYFDVGSIWNYWPFIFVVMGLSKLYNDWKNPERAGGGVWLIFFGLWLFVSIQHVWGLRFHNSWPFLLIAWGISVIWKSMGRPWLQQPRGE